MQEDQPKRNSKGGQQAFLYKQRLVRQSSWPTDYCTTNLKAGKQPFLYKNGEWPADIVGDGNTIVQFVTTDDTFIFGGTFNELLVALENVAWQLQV